MLEFIGILVIIAIIFGVSLQNAFLGLVSFIVGFIIFCIIASVLGDGATKFLDWANKPSAPKQKPAKTVTTNKTASGKQTFSVIMLFMAILIVIVLLLSLILYGDLSFGTGH